MIVLLLRLLCAGWEGLLGMLLLQLVLVRPGEGVDRVWIVVVRSPATNGIKTEPY